MEVTSAFADFLWSFVASLKVKVDAIFFFFLLPPPHIIRFESRFLLLWSFSPSLSSAPAFFHNLELWGIETTGQGFLEEFPAGIKS